MAQPARPCAMRAQATLFAQATPFVYNVLFGQTSPQLLGLHTSGVDYQQGLFVTGYVAVVIEGQVSYPFIHETVGTREWAKRTGQS